MLAVVVVMVMMLMLMSMVLVMVLMLRKYCLRKDKVVGLVVPLEVCPRIDRRRGRNAFPARPWPWTTHSSGANHPAGSTGSSRFLLAAGYSDAANSARRDGTNYPDPQGRSLVAVVVVLQSAETEPQPLGKGVVVVVDVNVHVPEQFHAGGYVRPQTLHQTVGNIPDRRRNSSPEAIVRRNVPTVVSVPVDGHPTVVPRQADQNVSVVVVVVVVPLEPLESHRVDKPIEDGRCAVQRLLLLLLALLGGLLSSSGCSAGCSRLTTGCCSIALLGSCRRICVTTDATAWWHLAAPSL